MAPVQTEEAVLNPVLTELVNWVNTLKTVGVSADKAVEVGRDFLLAACMSEHEEGDEEWDEEDDEEAN